MIAREVWRYAKMARLLGIAVRFQAKAAVSRQRSSVSRDEAECACAARWLAGVVRVIDAIRDRHLGEIERAHPVKASHVHGI